MSLLNNLHIIYMVMFAPVLITALFPRLEIVFETFLVIGSQTTAYFITLFYIFF